MKESLEPISKKKSNKRERERERGEKKPTKIERRRVLVALFVHTISDCMRVEKKKEYSWFVCGYISSNQYVYKREQAAVSAPALSSPAKHFLSSMNAHINPMYVCMYA